MAGGTSASSQPGTQGTLAFFDASLPRNNVSIYGNYTLATNAAADFSNLMLAGRHTDHGQARS